MDIYDILKDDYVLLRTIEENVPFTEITRYGIVSYHLTDYDPNNICGYALIRDEEKFYAIKKR